MGPKAKQATTQRTKMLKDITIEILFGIAMLVAVILLAVSRLAPQHSQNFIWNWVVPVDRPAYYRVVSDAPMPSSGFNL